VIETAFDCSPGYARRAEDLHLQGESADAMGLLKQGLARFPGDLTARLVLARICRDYGRDGEARAWLEGVLKLDPECPAALLQLAEILELDGVGQGRFLRLRLQAQEPWDPWYDGEDSAAAPVAPSPGHEPEIPFVPFAPTAILRAEDSAQRVAAPWPEPRATREVPAPHFTFPVREEEEEPEIEENSAPHVATVTLAEIYLQQGLKEQAAQIYRQLLERQPGDDSVRRRLQEIEAL
jgi:tetratricopeptide (TPR) repeat protein